MESVLAAQSDSLLSNLDFKISGSSSNYVISREESTYFPSNGMVSPNTIKEIRFQLASSNSMLDLSSAWIQMKVTNTDPTAGNLLRPVTCGCQNLFRRAIVKLSGVEVERIEDYSRCHSFLEKAALSPIKLEEISQLGWGRASGSFENGTAVANTIAGNGGSMNVLFSPSALGMISSNHKWIPGMALSSGGLILSLELDDATNSFLTTANSSTSYTITDIRLLMNTYILDGVLQEAMSSHLLSGKPLVLGPFKSLSSTTVGVGGSDRADITIARSFTRACTLIATLTGPTDSTRAQTKKISNDFYIPTASALADDGIQWRLTIGDKNWGANPYDTMKQLWYRLISGLGTLYSAAHSSSIDQLSFFNTNAAGNAEAANPSFAAIFDLEKVGGSIGSGHSTASGSLAVVQFKGMGSSTADYPTRLHTIIQHDVLCEILDGSCNVLT